MPGLSRLPVCTWNEWSRRCQLLPQRQGRRAAMGFTDLKTPIFSSIKEFTGKHVLSQLKERFKKKIIWAAVPAGGCSWAGVPRATSRAPCHAELQAHMEEPAQSCGLISHRPNYRHVTSQQLDQCTSEKGKFKPPVQF